jgi:hypothetical protein
MDFQNRQYDPQIGRFLGVDPLAEETDIMSPYTAMNNDPVLNVDPLGLQGINYMATPAGEDAARSTAAYYSSLTYALEHPFGDPLLEAAYKPWGTGGSGGQITLYGAQAQAAWAMMTGQEVPTPQGAVAVNDIGGQAGFTKDQVLDAGYILDGEDGKYFYSHEWTEGDNHSLNRQGIKLVKSQSNEAGVLNLAGAISVAVEGLAEALAATGVGAVVSTNAKAFSNRYGSFINRNAGNQPIIIVGILTNLAAGYIYSKGGNRNIWPDQYPKPDPRDVDWKQGDQELADGITGKDVPRGPSTPNNLIKKWFRDKRPR